MINVSETTTSSWARPSRLERRENRRYAFIADVELVDLESGLAIRARTADLSRGGCYVDMLNPLTEGSVVTLRLRKSQHVFEAQAKVVYARAGLGMGLMFVDLGRIERSVLETWIAQLTERPC
ncbi:MAG TPA: PilZ domain-containing protein [Candidatus Cybelea sp.]|nr:PilZ domain-containing protein [Candidatus Cybelea sp.]